MEEQNQLKMNNFIVLSQSKNIKKNEKKRKNLGKSIYEVYNLNKIGSIKFAKIHRSANRPLYKISEFNRNTEFCQCCNLPAEQEGIIEKFKFCDDPDSYVECGEGVSLYFTFFEFSIVVLFVTFFLVSLYNIIFSKKYYKELYEICNNKIKNNLIEEDCKLYSDELAKTKSYSLISNSYFFMYNSINTKYYRNLYYKITSTNNTRIENVIVNTSFMNFLCLLTLLIFNIFFMIIIHTKSQTINMSILSLSDYSLFISNLKDMHITFLKIKKELEEKKEIADKHNGQYDYEEELKKRLGIEKSLIDLPELEQFKCFLKNKICVKENGEPLNIKKINVCFKISELMELQEKLHKINEKMSKIKNHPYQISKNDDLNLYGNNKRYFSSFLDLHCCEKSETLLQLKQEEKSIKDQIEQLLKKSKEKTMDYFAGSVIVSLDKIKEHEEFLYKNSNNLLVYLLRLLKYIFLGCCIEKNKKDIFWLRRKIRFQRAPEPEDINFENIEYGNSLTRFFRTFLVYFVSFLFILICFIIVTALNYLQKYTNEKYNFNIIVAYIISLLISLSIQITNLVFEKILDFLTKKEKQSTTPNYYLSKSIKLALFSFMNQGIIPLISELYIETNGYEYLVINMLMIFLINSFIIPISWTVSLSFIYKKFRIWLIERNIDPDEPDGNLEKTQKELNDLYELPSMEIEEKYSYIFKTLLISFFYIQIFPLGVAISLIGLCLGYILERYNFCNMYRRPEMLNDILCKVYTYNFVIALFVCGIGDYIFKCNVYETKIWSLFNIILFGVLILLPYFYITNHLTQYCINLRESKIHKSSLDEIYFSFLNNYERANPMTKKEGIANHLKGLKDAGIISESIYQEKILNLENVNLMKLYYDDRKQRNILKTQKTIMRGENGNNKFSILMKSIALKITTLKDEEIEDLYVPVNDPTKNKDLSNTIFISNNNLDKNRNINNNGNENIIFNNSSERKIKFK